MLMSHGGVQAGRVAFRSQGELRLQIAYKAFEDDEVDAGYREGEAYSGMLQEQGISDVKSAAGMSALISQVSPHVQHIWGETTQDAAQV